MYGFYYGFRRFYNCDVCGMFSKHLMCNEAILGSTDRLCRRCFELWYDDGITDKELMQTIRRYQRQEREKFKGELEEARKKGEKLLDSLGDEDNNSEYAEIFVLGERKPRMIRIS